MRILLISTYEMGRQPFGLASPAAWLAPAANTIASAAAHCITPCVNFLRLKPCMMSSPLYFLDCNQVQRYFSFDQQCGAHARRMH